MSSSRATKRRRVDDLDPQLQHESSPALSERSPVTYGKQAQSSPATRVSGQSAAEMWMQARAVASRKFKHREKREKLADVYDDFEGANTGHYPYGRLDEQKARPQQRRAPADQGTPQKKRVLDPLVNQKSQESATPNKTAATGLGLFRQFRKDKPPVFEPDDSKTVAAKNGHKASATHTDESESGNDEGEHGSTRISKVPGAGSMRGYVYAEQKKTFEDEIRELEEQARKGVAETDSEDELASATDVPRSSARKSSRKRTSTRPHFEQQEKTSSRKAARRPLDRRKVQSARPVLRKERPRDDQQEIEIDDSEGEQVAEPDLAPMQTVQETLQSATSKKSIARSSQTSAANAMPAFEPGQLSIIQHAILMKTTGKRPIPLTNLADEYAKVYSIINQTVTAGESNSMLLIGARGSGKTALINQILQEQSLEHPDDFHAIRLNGFVHTDDKIALREIWRQLGREMELDEEESTSKSYADTMSKLLALLSHPAEIGISEQAGQVTKSIIFVLDEFELFAGHPRQTLLYNLFDIAQSRKAPIAVLGLTTRIDVAESLEKRVKSRFSHRYVHLSLSKSYPAFEQVCRRGLELTTSELSEAELQALGRTTKAQEGPDKPKTDVPMALIKWSTFVDRLLESEQVSTSLRRLYYTTKSVPDFLSVTTLTIATMPTTPETTLPSLIDHVSTSMVSAFVQAPDSKLSLLSTLSNLQLALLICAARLTNIYGTEIISFALVYEEYKMLASKSKLQASASGALAQGAGNRVWSKDVARGAWEELGSFGLVMIQAGGTGRVDVGLEEIGGSGVELGMWARWCKEI